MIYLKKRKKEKEKEKEKEKNTIELSHPCTGSTWERIRICVTTTNFYVLKKEKGNALVLP